MESGEGATARYDAAASALVRDQWWSWCLQLTGSNAIASAAAAEAIAYLQRGLPADVVAALVRLRLSRGQVDDQMHLDSENAYCVRVRGDVAELVRMGVIDPSAAAAIDRDYTARQAALAQADVPITLAAAEHSPAPAEAATVAKSSPPTITEPQPATAPATPEKTHAARAESPPAPSGPAFSLRELVAQHSVIILASLGAFLLVVATVLFELYGTAGLGGPVRLGAVVALNLIFASAGYFALGRERLRDVGQIYVALAAVLLPLVCLAAWTFLGLGRQGITVDQALALSGIACALAYGVLAYRLRLRAYGEMAGIAIFVAVWGISGATAGNTWRSVGLALLPLVYATWLRLLPSSSFADFPWLAHGSAAIAAGAAVSYWPWNWHLTATLAVIAAAYLAWQALAPHPSRAWIGEASLVLAATAATDPLGGYYRFALPLAAGLPMLMLARVPTRLGIVGRLYRSHPAHLHLAVGAGLAIALAQTDWHDFYPLSLALWLAFALYTADFGLGPSASTGYAMRAALPLALAATGRSAGWEAWTAVLVAASGLAYLVAYVKRLQLSLLTRDAAWFFYGALVLIAIELHDARFGVGEWQVPAALLASALSLGIVSELGDVPVSALAARVLFSAAWFAGVEALGARGWRGPFDALLALLYAGVAQVRAAARHRVATVRRRDLVHAAAVVSVAICFAGPQDLLWWRLAAAFGLLAVTYWLQAITRTTEKEMPWVAWSTLAAALSSLVIAVVPELWQGAALAAGAVLLTAGWALIRRIPGVAPLEQNALPILGLLAALGIALTLRQGPPQWSQAAATVLTGAFLLAWSLLRSESHQLRQVLRAGAATLTTVGMFTAAAVIQLDAAWVGLIAVALAAGYAEWHVRSKGEIERWYALGALFATVLMVVAWPYGHLLALVGLDLLALSAVAAGAAVRGRRWTQAYVIVPAVLILVPAVHFGLAAMGVDRPAQREESVMAGLAGLVGFAGLVLRTRFRPEWARMTQLGAGIIAAGSLIAMAITGAWDAAGIAFLAYAAIIYAAGMQERERSVLPFAAAALVAGTFTLLGAHGADTILYAAALGIIGLIVWLAGRLVLEWLGAHPVVDMQRYLGLGLLVAAAIAGFAFPDRTGRASLGGALAGVALLVTGGILWLDARTFGFRPNLYLGVVSGFAAGYFVARELGLDSWELVPIGIGVVACGIALRQERGLEVERSLRQLIVGVGLSVIMGWAAVHTLKGEVPWLVALLIEGALTVAVGIVLRSRVLLAGGGAAIALVSLRALLLVAERGYLYVAFAVVALVLLAGAMALALGRDRYIVGAREAREQLADWD